jgi:DNA-binding IclR family transcriptional regulator
MENKMLTQDEKDALGYITINMGFTQKKEIGASDEKARELIVDWLKTVNLAIAQNESQLYIQRASNQQQKVNLDEQFADLENLKALAAKLTSQ